MFPTKETRFPDVQLKILGEQLSQDSINGIYTNAFSIVKPGESL